MSKKSRKRNKRLLMLAALAGGAAFLGRGKKKFGTDAGFLKSGAAGGASLAADAAPKTQWIKKKVDAPVIKTDYITKKEPVVAVRKAPYGKMRGAGLTDAESIAAQDKRAAYAQRGRGINPFEETAAAGAAYIPRIPRVFNRMVNQGTTLRAKGGRIGAKKGGSVTGIAKRGFGRALKKK